MQDKYVYAIFFALLFASLSWVVPAGYYTIAPQESMLAVEEVSVDTTDPTTHTLNISYEARGDYIVEAQILLFQKNEADDVDITQQKWSIEGFIERGVHQTSLTLDLNQPVPPGLYYYEVRIRFRPGYNVERTAIYKTTPFTISNNTTSDASSSTGNESASIPASTQR